MHSAAPAVESFNGERFDGFRPGRLGHGVRRTLRWNHSGQLGMGFVDCHESMT
ncbi:hypothetical protein E4U55_005546, partial [Claviceps digitariae]